MTAPAMNDEQAQAEIPLDVWSRRRVLRLRARALGFAEPGEQDQLIAAATYQQAATVDAAAADQRTFNLALDRLGQVRRRLLTVSFDAAGRVAIEGRSPSGRSVPGEDGR